MNQRVCFIFSSPTLISCFETVFFQNWCLRGAPISSSHSSSVVWYSCLKWIPYLMCLLICSQIWSTYLYEFFRELCNLNLLPAEFRAIGIWVEPVHPIVAVLWRRNACACQLSSSTCCFTWSCTAVRGPSSFLLTWHRCLRCHNQHTLFWTYCKCNTSEMVMLWFQICMLRTKASFFSCNTLGTFRALFYQG